MPSLLQPCPFCGHEANSVSDYGRGLMFNVHCGNGSCRATGPWERCADDAAHAWNTRAMQAVRPSDGVVEALLGPEGDDGTLGRFGWLSAFMNDLKAAANLDRDDMVIFALDDPPATWEAIQEIDNLIHEVRQALAATNQESVSE